MQPKFYVISGVAGMTGNELARQLLQQGDVVLGFDNFFASSPATLEDLYSHPNFRFFEYDINRAAEMEEIFHFVEQEKKSYPEIIYIHCAAIVHTEHFYHVNRTFCTNVLGMKGFLEQAKKVGACAFLNCSTSEVYSMHSWSEDGVKESDSVLLATAEQSQRTSYATGKLLTEFFLKDAVESGELRGCSIRFANVYSKNERFAKHVIPHILHSLLKDGRVALLENARNTRRTFLHNIDSCSAVLALSDTASALDGSVYNVATDEEIAILDLVQFCGNKLGISNPEIVYSGSRSADPERRLLNTEKIRIRTGWAPKVTLEQGITECIDYLKRNPAL